MSDCSGDYFIMNGSLLQIKEFDTCFLPNRNYIYEVFRIIDNIPLFIEDHIERFFQTMLLADEQELMDRQALLKDISLLIRQNNGGDGNIKIAIQTEESGSKNLLLYFTPHLYPSNEQFISGVAVDLLHAERHNPTAKVMDVPLRAQADMLKQKADVYEMLLVDKEGFITEGSRSNVFFIKDRSVITPPLNCALPGITQKHIIKICRDNNITLTESKIHTNQLNSIDALFISGTSRKVLPVNRVGELIFDVDNQLLKQIQTLFNQHVADYIQQRK